jgi:hypothetical protein
MPRNNESKNFETKVQIDVSEYIKDKFPDVIFTAESSGIKLTMGQSIVAKRCRSSRGLPDIWIVEPRKGYAGCFLELKKDDVKIYKKNGELRNEKHLQEQEEISYRLKQKGYFCEFAVGYDEAVKIVDWYLG